MAEQMNSVMEEVRGKPIIALHVGLSKWATERYTKSADKAAKWTNERHMLTEYATGLHAKCVQEGTRLQFTSTGNNGPVFNGQVHHSRQERPTATVDVTVNCEENIIKCSIMHAPDHI